MPQITKLDPAELDQFRTGGPAGSRLDEYFSYLRPMKEGEGLKIEVEPGEDVKIIKTRFTKAARRLGIEIEYLPVPRASNLIVLRVRKVAGNVEAERLLA